MGWGDDVEMGGPKEMRPGVGDVYKFDAEARDPLRILWV